MGQTLVGSGTSLILSIMLVFLLMVALYNSYRSPFIIMFSVPVAAVGALGALLITHQTLNLFSLIGTILLVGIVTKNGILLVDYANTLRERGESKWAAIQESAYTRFRPIIMTSISVIAGNVPLALALEPGVDACAPASASSSSAASRARCPHAACSCRSCTRCSLPSTSCPRTAARSTRAPTATERPPATATLSPERFPRTLSRGRAAA